MVKLFKEAHDLISEDLIWKIQCLIHIFENNPIENLKVNIRKYKIFWHARGLLFEYAKCANNEIRFLVISGRKV